MDINQLIEELEELKEEHGGDTEVRIAQQPNYPFEYNVGKVVAVKTNQDELEEIKEEMATNLVNFT